MKEAVELLKKEGWGLIPPSQYLIDMENEFQKMWDTVRNYTMISIERGYSLYKSTEYIVKKGIPGDLVECGVWKGGSCMLMALTLKKLGADDRKIYLYDTFSGMTEPGKEDIIAWNGRDVLDKWEKDGFDSWAVSQQEVRSILSSVDVNMNTFIFVEGDVMETLDTTVPAKISLLRLDTDWYESTAKELEILYPVLSTGGVLVIDDYGHFKGSRKAVDEFFRKDPILLTRVDYTGREGIKY